MTTVIIDTSTTEAKKMLEFLKSTKYATVIEEDQETLNNIKEGLNELDLARKGKLHGKSAKQFLSEL